MWRRCSLFKIRQLHVRTATVLIITFCLIVVLLGYQYGSYYNYTRDKKRLMRIPDDVMNTGFPWMPLDKGLTTTINANIYEDSRQNRSILSRDIVFNWEGWSIIELKQLNPTLSLLNRFERPYVIEPRDICKDSPFLVILVFSVHTHVSIRDAIRRTWGSIANGKKWPGTSLNVDVKLLFLFGRPSSYPEMEYIIKTESKKFKDILQGDFVDVYNHLTLKTLMGLRFLLQYCSDIDYVLKADEDTFTNIPLLVQFLQLHVPTRAVIGHIYNEGSRVHRSGAWKVDSSVYPMDVYPRYAAGNTYVLSADLLPCLVNTSHYIPYIPIEDVHVTGIAAALCDARHMNVVGFAAYEAETSVCAIVYGRQIAANKISEEMALDVWTSIMGYPCE